MSHSSVDVLGDGLRRGAPEPLYFQLAETLKQRIEFGTVEPGDQLPAETDIAATLGISRMTVRQAIASLVREGILERRHGAGTFVSAPKVAHDPLHPRGFTAEMTGQGLPVRSVVLEQGTQPASDHVASRLRLAPGTSVHRIVRLRLVHEIPVLLETVHLPASLYPDLAQEDLERQSLYELITSQSGVRIGGTEQTLDATTANRYEAKLLAAEVGQAMVLVEGVTASTEGLPLEYFRALYRGDRVRFKLHSGGQAPASDAKLTRVSVELHG